ncbi:hypothetical protein KL906_002426 [Ogataea polymorpha]|uniref:Peptide hydrolase n=1 Tax=Ogataea polymorpha TaxID=460523 RepID=A0A9P8PS52_9ASCO|nr:hypothetical protein KL906_002426 [Ogataea polymorpha]KAH3676617.1 hypothetical protein OGATHE_001106 [Ogataea polymorpha]
MIFGLLFVGLAAAVPLFGQQYHLISLQPNELTKVTEAQLWRLKQQNTRFLDLTASYPTLLEPMREGQSVRVTLEKPAIVYNYPNASEFHEKEVNSLLADIDPSKIQGTLEELSSFKSRYYKSEKYLDSSIWVYNKLLDYALGRDNYNLTVVNHEKFPQSSYILRITGTNNSVETPTIVLGAHIDSMNLVLPSFLRAPGADDDGSGVVTLLETLRIVTEHGLSFPNHIEFHFYAAEEGGMLGSLDIFNAYFLHKKVVAMLQQDMTGYVAKSLRKGRPEHFGLIADYTSPYLNEFLRQVIETYCRIPVFESACDYPCSDHYSAHMNGFPAGMVAEAQREYWNPYVHTTADTIDKLSMLHIAEHVKLCLGYVYELGEYSF